MKTALVCGAGGFIGHHLTRFLKARDYWVRGVDIKAPEFGKSDADEFELLDLRSPDDCKRALSLESGDGFTEVYQLAADMGGMGFIHAAECEIMTNSALVNMHMVNEASRAGVGRYFFSSSACVYRDQQQGESYLSEDDAYPALPDNEYGWEKLYAERMALAFSRNHGLDVRIARFQNCYGPEGTWEGGREKAPAAMCRKIAIARDGDEIEVWGDGSALRVYTYVADMCEGIYTLMQSDVTEPTNIGSTELTSVTELVDTVAAIAGKSIGVKHIDGPIGVQDTLPLGMLWGNAWNSSVAQSSDGNRLIVYEEVNFYDLPKEHRWGKYFVLSDDSANADGEFWNQLEEPLPICSREMRAQAVGLSNGHFALAWVGHSGLGLGIWYQILDAGGVALTDPQEANSWLLPKALPGPSPGIAALGDGSFIIVWASCAPEECCCEDPPQPPQDGDGCGIFAQRIGPQGEKLYR